MAGAAGGSVFYYVRNCQTVFQSDSATLHSQKQCMRVPIADVLANTVLLVLKF